LKTGQTIKHSVVVQRGMVRSSINLDVTDLKTYMECTNVAPWTSWEPFRQSVYR